MNYQAFKQKFCFTVCMIRHQQNFHLKNLLLPTLNPFRYDSTAFSRIIEKRKHYNAFALGGFIKDVATMYICSYTADMHGKVIRHISDILLKRLDDYPVAALLGVRQCGKTTLAKELLSGKKDVLYVDMEKPSDRNKLINPEAFLFYNKDKLVCLDEIQRVPELFPVIRSVVDEVGRNGQLLILGSASQELLKQSSETLAGRISYLHLSPFLLPEIGKDDLIKLWTLGGMPKSFLAKSKQVSLQWRLDFITTFIERDIPMFGFSIPSPRIERFWKLCAHNHGQVVNISKLAQIMELSLNTVKSYIEILEQTFVIRTLQPYFSNSKKRLVKSPKIYIRDTGILHALLKIESYNDLLADPVYGASWESFVIENIINVMPMWSPYFYRTSNGNEVDLILEKGNKRIAIECKSSSSPNVTKGFYQVLDDLDIKEAYVVAPVDDIYPLKDGVYVISLWNLVERLLEKK